MRALMAIGLAAALAVGVQAQNAELKVGDTAPDFSLQASDGKTYKLSDFRGKQAVVVAWFPKAFTAGCTIECKSLAENGDKIKKYDVANFMASVDSIEDNTAFAKATSVKLGDQVVEKKEADFPMLSDPTKETAKAYGVLHERGFSNRWTFYIDKTGKVVAIDTAVRPATSAEDMLAKLTPERPIGSRRRWRSPQSDDTPVRPDSLARPAAQPSASLYSDFRLHAHPRERKTCSRETSLNRVAAAEKVTRRSPAFLPDSPGPTLRPGGPPPRVNRDRRQSRPRPRRRRPGGRTPG